MSNLETLLLVAPVLLFSMVAHEIAHGYAALRQGDDTALRLGRLTWNPLKHIDPWLTVLLPLLLYKTTGMAVGGAKPVPVDPRKYRDYRRGDIIVSLAGVGANSLIVAGCIVLMILVGAAGRAAPAAQQLLGILQTMFLIGVFVNMSLIAFNLIPIPPLDGSHVVKHFLPPAWAARYQRIGFFGILILLLVIRTRLFDWWMSPVFFVTSSALEVVQRLGVALPGLGQALR